ncbi:MAG: hypothetical protein ACREEM_38895 [Blastocatellia bacterium]
MLKRILPSCLIIVIFAGLASSFTVAQTKDSRARGKKRSVAKIKMMPGYYFTIGLCHACAYFGWHEEAIKLLETVGIRAEVGGYETKTSNQPFTLVTAFNMHDTRGEFWPIELYIGPFESDVSATQALEQFPPILTGIIRSREKLDGASSDFSGTAEVRNRSGNNYDFGESSFFRIRGYNLQPAPTNSGKLRVPASQTSDWQAFWNVFCTAVQRHDRRALKSMMAGDFEWTFGGESNTPDNAFRYWDRPDVRGWLALDKALAQGTVPYQQGDPVRAKRPSRIAPPAAAGDNYYNWRAVFELGPDGRWRWVAFVKGD